jgi:hypothetical protein
MASRVLHVNVEVRSAEPSDATCNMDEKYYEHNTNSKDEMIEAVLKRVRRILEKELVDGNRMRAWYGHEWKG